MSARFCSILSAPIHCSLSHLFDVWIWIFQNDLVHFSTDEKLQKVDPFTFHGFSYTEKTITQNFILFAIFVEIAVQSFSCRSHGNLDHYWNTTFTASCSIRKSQRFSCKLSSANGNSFRRSAGSDNRTRNGIKFPWKVSFCEGVLNVNLIYHTLFFLSTVFSSCFA